MNKLVIIGNGFDLAHDLNTRYSDFVLWYFNKVFKDSQSKFKYDAGLFVLEKNFNSGYKEFYSIEELQEFIEESGSIKINYSNNYTEDLFTNILNGRWVDIEYHFYQHIVSIYKEAEKHDFLVNGYDSEDVELLNESFELLKNHLEEYLSTQNNNSNEIFSEIANHFDIHNIHDAVTTTILNFNYTKTISRYFVNAKIINIHGSLNDKKNPIIFGYGDEMDSQYSKIEDLNKNVYLEYFKSFGYSRNRNYQDLMLSLEKQAFEVFIMGHSCGISDRVLLNNIFEHRNCRNIRIFYYDIDGVNNDFFEKVKEISRHFSSNSKHEMRKRIIPFQNSSPLIRFTD